METLEESIAGAPERVNQYYRQCRKNQLGKPKEHCAKVAWSIFCSHVDPRNASCGKVSE